MFIRAYLRASTDQQDASRAKQQLQIFAKDRGLKIATYYIENVSGASLQRPELFRLLEDSESEDILLLEQVDRLSRLTAGDWEKLKSMIRAKGVRIVALDLPTSWSLMTATQDDFTARMVAAINDMLLDMLAAIARKDFEDRRRRQAQGIEQAKIAGLYKGRRENKKKNEQIMVLLKEGKSWSTIQSMIPISKATLALLSKRLRNQHGKDAFMPTPGYVVPEISDETLENMANLDYHGPKIISIPKRVDLYRK